MTHINGARGTARRPGHLFSHEEAPRGPIFAERRQGCASWFIEFNFSRPLEVWRVRAVPWVTDYYLVTRLARCWRVLHSKLMRRDANYEISKDFNCFLLSPVRATWQRINCIPFDEYYFPLCRIFVSSVAKL